MIAPRETIDFLPQFVVAQKSGVKFSRGAAVGSELADSINNNATFNCETAADVRRDLAPQPDGLTHQNDGLPIGYIWDTRRV